MYKIHVLGQGSPSTANLNYGPPTPAGGLPYEMHRLGGRTEVNITFCTCVARHQQCYVLPNDNITYPNDSNIARSFEK